MAKTMKECEALRVKLAKLANTPHDATDGLSPHKCCRPFCNIDKAQRTDWDSFKARDWKQPSPQRTGIRLGRRGLIAHTGKSPVKMAYVEAEYGPAYRGRGATA